jgi:hypothetical protein
MHSASEDQKDSYGRKLPPFPTLPYQSVEVQYSVNKILTLRCLEPGKQARGVQVKVLEHVDVEMGNSAQALKVKILDGSKMNKTMLLKIFDPLYVDSDVLNSICI